MTSGVNYRLARDWLIMLHEGEWLGETLEPFVVLLNALELLWLLMKGAMIPMDHWRRKVR